MVFAGSAVNRIPPSSAVSCGLPAAIRANTILVLRSLLRFLVTRPWRAARTPRSPADAAAAAEQLRIGRELKAEGRASEAILRLRRAHALDPEAPDALRELVSALIESDLCDKALAVAAAAAERAPSSLEANLCLGLALHKLHLPERALERFEIARRLRPEDAELHDLRGSAFLELGRLQEAFAEFDRALALRPGHSLAQFHRGLARLLVQDFEHGWDDYEVRRREANGAGQGRIPAWDGAPLAGRTILVRREQGLGDEIMFASLLPELIRMAGHCLVECDPRLRTLLRRSFPSATVFGSIPDGSLPFSLSRQHIDAEIPAGSLPRLRRRRAADFPRHEGYLAADPGKVGRWRDRLDQLGGGLKVGISWAGGVRKTRRALRSIPLPELLPVLRTQGARFVSLQYTAEAPGEVGDLQARHGVRIEHWPEAIENYDETAALVSALDLVISVCTSVVHLGGALGRPVWVMAPYSPEWRYGFTGETMVWYPSVRLFRQPAYGRWGPVLDAVAAQLSRRAAAGG